LGGKVAHYLGLDIGSVSVKAVIIDRDRNVIEDHYHRTKGQPIWTVLRVLDDIFTRFPPEQIGFIATTGTGGQLVAELLGGVFINEVVAQTKAVSELYPHVRTVIEMGGEDSKFLLIGEDGTLKDFAMNTACAAGTGSFLDQQAARLGINIEGEFGQLALMSKHPPRIAGRCSVFAKSDMIHLQQIGTPLPDILHGLCHTVARNFKSTIARGKIFQKPIIFQGGVASNAGMVKAFSDILGLAEGELIIPEHHTSMGAIGAVLHLLDRMEGRGRFKGLGEMERYLQGQKEEKGGWEPLYTAVKEEIAFDTRTFPIKEKKVDAFLGVDVGSLSTNVVVIDRDVNILARRYLMTAGRPLEAVKRGLMEVGREIGGKVDILGVGTTGSGRYLTGAYVGADIVKNEITAQATAALHFHEDVDTIFEIGGQDSKYISIENGVVVDFEMNKVCAAGTGSFLEEQAEKLGISISGQFGQLALSSHKPCRFGDRCTVFMESDLCSFQQKGAKLENLVAGLAYSIVLNYLTKVVGDKRIGNKILFQGGVAWNKAVVAAFKKVLGKEIFVPPHHDVTGAIGAAILAMNCGTKKTNFKGFDLSGREYKTSTFECKACPNRCDVTRVKFEKEKPLFYGARCDIFDIRTPSSTPSQKLQIKQSIPDLFDERENLLLSSYLNAEKKQAGRKRMGIPRVLHFYELFPYWNRFFSTLGFEVILSDSTNQKLIQSAAEIVSAETCFPIKIVHGHILNLLEKGVDYIFLPSIINMAKNNDKLDQSYTCPMVQAVPYIIKSAMDLKGVELLHTPIHFAGGKNILQKDLAALGRSLRRSRKEVIQAMIQAEREQENFVRSLKARGKEVLENVDGLRRNLVILSRPYNGCDPGINMNLPKKLKKLGVLAIPMDFLPIEGIDISEEHPNMYWSYGQRIIEASRFIRNNPFLDAIFVTNFNCGPDSFLIQYVKEELKENPPLILEMDEHSADAGLITRCEAFLDSLGNVRGSRFETQDLKPNRGLRHGTLKHVRRTIYLPHMSPHAHALAATFRRYGTEAEVIPESDQETVELGRRFTSGKECFPFTLTFGDFLKKAREPAFEPAKSAFFMPSADGPCRFGQYMRLQRMLLDRLGYEEVAIISPSSKDSYNEICDMGPGFRRIAWQGIVAVDILEKLTWETRPYEINKGETDEMYRMALKMIEQSLEGRKNGLMQIVKEIGELYRAIKVDRDDRRPIIGIVGEIFLRWNAFSNANIVRRVEDLGAEAWIASITEWIYYVNQCRIEDTIKMRNYSEFFKNLIQNLIQRYDEHRFMNSVQGMLLNSEEPTIKEIYQNSSPYLHSSFGGEAILSVGRAVDLIERGVSGIINVMPFTCMPGSVVTALSKKIQEDYHGIPWLNIAFDGQEDATLQTRLEAFIYQAKEFRDARLKGVK